MRKSNNLKLQLFINFITSYLSSFISIGVQFFFIPFLIIGIGISNYGIYTLFLFFSLTGGLSLFDFGIQGTMVKLLAGSIGINDKQKVTKYVIESAILFLSLAILFASFTFIINFFFFKHLYHINDINDSFIFLFSFLAAINLLIDFIFIYASSIFEATMRKDLLDIINTSKILFFTLTIILSFLYFGKNITVVLILSIITNAIFTLISIYLGYRLVKQFLIKTFEFHWNNIFSLFKQSRYLFISRFIGFLDSQFPRIIVSTLLPIKYLGMYDVVFRIIGIVRTLGNKITQIGLIAYSSILQEKNDRSGLQYYFLNMTKFSFLIIIPLIIALFFFIETFLKIWLKSEYIEIENLIRLYLFQLLLTTCINVGGIMLIGLNKVKIILKPSIILFIITTIFSYLSTYIWNLQGLAICTTISTMIFIPLYLRKLLIEFELSATFFLKNVLEVHSLISLLFIFAYTLLTNFYTPHSLLEIILIVASTWLIYFTIYFNFGLNIDEKIFVFNYKTKLFNILRKHIRL
jgi:stage V sporulation protein B